MKFEKYTAVLGPENRFENETGTQFEEHMLPKVESDWNGKKWRESPHPERESILFKWVQKNILSKMSDDKKRDVFNIPKVSHRNPRRSGNELNDQRLTSAWRHLDEKKRKELILKWCEENQPKDWDPFNPKSNFEMNRFHAEVSNALEQLGVDPKEVAELKLFSTLRTPVDDMNGIDGFFDVGGVLLSLDLTRNKLKSEAGLRADKADMAITDTDLVTEEGVKNIAQNAARALKSGLDKKKAATTEQSKKAA